MPKHRRTSLPADLADVADARAAANRSGGVTSVTASTPLASSGGATPNISIASAVPIADGGTGQVTALAAINALLPSQGGNAGKVLETDGTNPSWQTPSGGGGTTETVLVPNLVSGGGAAPAAWSGIPFTLHAGKVGGFRVNAACFDTSGGGEAVPLQMQIDAQPFVTVYTAAVAPNMHQPFSIPYVPLTELFAGIAAGAHTVSVRFDATAAPNVGTNAGDFLRLVYVEE